MFAGEIRNIVENHKIELKKIGNDIFSFAETGHKEYKSSQLLVNFLRQNGFALQYPYGGLDTAFRADYGSGKPVFCVMCEYDALPEIGHACGHHLIATAAVGAGIAIKEVIEKHALPGKITVIGTPAEEAYGGKIDMIKAGAFDNIDAAILCHPYNRSGIDPGELAVSRFDVEFTGLAAHAAAAPHKGINALDALNLLFAGLNAWRQHLPDSSRVHGFITDGGDAANIIPAHAAGTFYLRSLSNDYCSVMESRFRNIVKGAALMTGCSFECRILPNSYLANRPNPVLDDFVEKQLAQNGLGPEKIYDRFSSDYGNISQFIPSCNFLFAISKDNSEAALHSLEFKKLASQDYAFEQTLKAAAVMAATGTEFLSGKLDPQS